MRYLFCISLSTMLSISCSRNESGGDRKPTVGVSAKCAQQLGICLGDKVIYTELGSSLKEATINTILMPGELSNWEKAYVKHMGPHLGPGWEESFRKSSNEKGIRLYFDDGSSPVSTEIFGKSFEKVFRLSGCDTSQKICAGDSRISLESGHAINVKVLGLSLISSVKRPYLVEWQSMSSGESNIYERENIGPALKQEGCVWITPEYGPFCVGDQHFVVYSKNYKDKNLTIASLSYISADDEEPMAVFMIRGGKSKVLTKESMDKITVYSNKVCVEETSSICLPNLEGAQIFSFKGYTPNTYTLHGISIPKPGAGTKSFMWVKNIAGESEFIETLAELKWIYLGKGCISDRADDGKEVTVCVGKTYTLPLLKGEWECIGINYESANILLRQKKKNVGFDYNTTGITSLFEVVR